jgi:hypothetical protein
MTVNGRLDIHNRALSASVVEQLFALPGGLTPARQ